MNSITKYDINAIPEYEFEQVEIYRDLLSKRLDACKLRYADMQEHMEIPDMDLWLKIKKEIFEKTRPKPLQRYTACYHNGQEIGLHLNFSWDPEIINNDKEQIDKEEIKYLKFKDKHTSGRRRRDNSF